MIDCQDVRRRVAAECLDCMRRICILEVDLIKSTAGDRFGITVECSWCGEIDREIMDSRYLHWLIRDEKAVILGFFGKTSVFTGHVKYREVRLFEKEDAQQIADIASLIWGCRDGETA